jgi:hypothetical protein
MSDEPTTETKQERRQRKTEARAERYRRSKSAEAEVGRRLGLALDRLSAASGGNVAQVFHAVHYIQRGYADDSRLRPADSPDVTFPQATSEELVTTLNWLLTLARNAKWTVAEVEALPDE